MDTFKGVKFKDNMIVTVVSKGIKYPGCMIANGSSRTYVVSNFCFPNSNYVSRPQYYKGRKYFVELTEWQFDRIEIPGRQGKWANQALRNRLIEKNII